MVFTSKSSRLSDDITITADDVMSSTDDITIITDDVMSGTDDITSNTDEITITIITDDIIDTDYVMRKSPRGMLEHILRDAVQ